MPCKAYCVYKNHRWKITKDSVEIVLHAAEEQGKKEGEPVKMGHVQVEGIIKHGLWMRIKLRVEMVVDWDGNGLVKNMAIKYSSYQSS